MFFHQCILFMKFLLQRNFDPTKACWLQSLLPLPFCYRTYKVKVTKFCLIYTLEIFKTFYRPQIDSFINLKMYPISYYTPSITSRTFLKGFFMIQNTTFVVCLFHTLAYSLNISKITFHLFDHLHTNLSYNNIYGAIFLVRAHYEKIT